MLDKATIRSMRVERRLLGRAGSIRLPVVLLMGTVLLAGCDYQIPVKHGYRIGRVWSGTLVVVDPGSRIVVGPTIEGYQVSGDVLFGRVRSSASTRTYFIVDMKARQVESDLSISEWRRRLLVRGIVHIDLKQPSRGDTVR